MQGIDAYVRRLLERVHPIVVANRAPLFLQRPAYGGPGEERLVRGGGGLVTAMSSLATATGALWVAAARNDLDRELAARAEREGGPVTLTSEDGQDFRVAFVDAGQRAFDLFYTVISNPLLWFIQHYLWDLAREPVLDSSTAAAWRDGYVHVNRLFADRVVAEARSQDRTPLVLVQDYQLYCVPRMVREQLDRVWLQHFVHIPWPNAEYWRILPRYIRDGVLQGLLGCDIIGFQSSRDVSNFLLTCEHNLGLSVDFRERAVLYEGRVVWARHYPISVDTNELRALSNHPLVLEEEERIKLWRPQHLILRVDRTDLSKNIVRGFLSYERMLENQPQLHGDVQFWAFLQETRQDIDDYRAYLGNVVSVAARINRRFAAHGWMPIRLEIESNIHKAVAAYKSFDVLLVNSIYDGMNLVAKEGPLCNARDGVLVLSENAGSHEELGDMALTINPFDVDETAEALWLGITMSPEERRSRAERLRETVRAHDVTRWITRQLQDMRDVMDT